MNLSMPAKLDAIQWSAHQALAVQSKTSATLNAASRLREAARRTLEEKEKNHRDLLAVRYESRRPHRTGATAVRARATRVAAYLESGTKLVHAEDAITEATAVAQVAEQAWHRAQHAHRIAAGRVVALIAVARSVNKEELSAFVAHRRASV